MPTDEPHRVEPDTLGGLRTIHDHPVRVVYDGWRGRDRVLRYYGACIVCDRKTWAFDDGENDPRGMLGDHALWTTTAELRDGSEIELRTCAICANDYGAYQTALSMAREPGVRVDRLTPFQYGPNDAAEEVQP